MLLGYEFLHFLFTFGVKLNLSSQCKTHSQWSCQFILIVTPHQALTKSFLLSLISIRIIFSLIHNYICFLPVWGLFLFFVCFFFFVVFLFFFFLSFFLYSINSENIYYPAQTSYPSLAFLSTCSGTRHLFHIRFSSKTLSENKFSGFKKIKQEIFHL